MLEVSSVSGDLSANPNGVMIFGGESFLFLGVDFIESTSSETLFAILSTASAIRSLVPNSESELFDVIAFTTFFSGVLPLLSISSLICFFCSLFDLAVRMALPIPPIAGAIPNVPKFTAVLAIFLVRSATLVAVAPNILPARTPVTYELPTFCAIDSCLII